MKQLNIKNLFLFGLLLIAVPFVLYAFARLSGQLISEQEWLRLNQRRGPWRDEWQSLILYVPFFAPFMTAIVSLISAQKQKISESLVGAGLTIFQSMVAFIPMLVLYWTVS